ncbi:dTDP-4-dehydrorhamnose 3,5-epimerase [Shewanella sp. 10N.286.52.C2]|uniref:dTDP-4-dehydrorhamnose 3,5-epimerase n=1 Tax=Shewanella sp. 10N.286.52.C2 TaxID=1880838 RepID=UPI000C83D83A|nr:dTDP-4-dehydrorhamnose 3,5-epimerase [Shewanella sp. 10N.286.52.C2]PMG31147.1 dTDP-4-dehydrorhamnose 3,5-epimerase [Shewanella sp. 10N.286.52.C2]
MKVIDTSISDVKIIEPQVFADERGFFMETFQQQRYQQLLNTNKPLVQDNYSRSHYGVLRGLHFQTQKPQAKLVRVVRGKVYDVVVDIRPQSSTYGAWVGVELSETNQRQLWVPEGFAHGFVALEACCDVEYKCSDYYDPKNEACLSWDDADLAINWPIREVIQSAKDQQGLSFQALKAMHNEQALTLKPDITK